MKRAAVTTEEVEAKSWEHAQELLFRDAWDEGIKRFRSSFVFRGVEDSDFRLETSLIRLGGPYAKLEPHLVRNFRKYSPRTAVVQDNLALADARSALRLADARARLDDFSVHRPSLRRLARELHGAARCCVDDRPDCVAFDAASEGQACAGQGRDLGI